jgi:DNA polymerase-3 subunit alpha
VNRSAINFSLEVQEDGTKAIRFGLACIKNAGEGMAEGIVDERASDGAFARIEDFFDRVPVKHLNKRALESLVKAGAFDALAERASLLATLDRLIGYAQGEQRQRESGQTSLFDLMSAEDQPAVAGPSLEQNVREAPQQQKLAWEKELLGIYLSEHPFRDAAAELRQILSCSIAEVNAELSGRDVIIGGIVTGVRTLTTKDGRAFLAVELEDQTGSLEVTVWPETYEQTREMWQATNIVIVNARIKDRDDRLSAAVQKAVLYGDGPVNAQALFVEPQPSYGQQRGYRRNGGNGNGRHGNGGEGAKSQEPGARSQEPRRTEGGEPGAIAEPASAYEPAAPYAPQGGSSTTAAPAEAPVYGAAAVERLRITLEETDDADGDHERLQALVDTLRDYSGESSVRLRILQRDGAEIELDLPGARCSPELTRRLEGIVGPWGAVSG